MQLGVYGFLAYLEVFEKDPIVIEKQLYLKTNKFNQSILEGYFGQQRNMAGHNKLTAHQVNVNAKILSHMKTEIKGGFNHTTSAP